MERRQRRSFTPEFKARTVELIQGSGRSIPEICRELDLSETAVRRWVSQAEVDAGERPGSRATSAPSWRAFAARTASFARSGRS